MPMFGTTVSAYNKKPSTALTSFSTRKFAPTPVAPKVSTPSISPMNTAVKPVTVDPTKSAVTGSSNINASGLIGNQPHSVFQPMDTGQIGARNTEGEQGSYNRLNAIDQTTQVLNDNMTAKLNIYQAAAAKRNAALQQQSSMSGNYGNAGDLYGGGGNSGLDAEQLQYARQIASVGKARGMGDDAIQIALMTALTESGLRNLNHGDRDSVGLFQQRTSQGWGSVQQIMDPNYSANKFYDTLAKTNYKGMSPWQAAQSVQRSFDPTGSNYQRQYGLAQQAFRSLTPNQSMGMNYASSGGKAPAGLGGFIQQYNNKYIDYDGAYGAQCVDLYNTYTAKFVGGQNVMVGWAPEIFNAYDTKAYARYNGNQTAGRMGDVAVFRPGAATPSGHVAIVIGDNGNGTLRVLQSNATALGSRGPSIISNISKSSLMGYLRPRRLM